MRHIVKDTATPVFIQKHSLNNFSYSLESIEKNGNIYFQCKMTTIPELIQ